MHNKCYDVSRDIYGETLELCQCFKHMLLRIMHNKCYDVSRDPKISLDICIITFIVYIIEH
jgi:hypothetical protein